MLTFSAIFGHNLCAQGSLPESEKQFDSVYQKRIQQEMLYGVYIPVDLLDAFRELRRLSAKDDLAAFRSGNEAVVIPRLHFGIGRWMAHNWGFYGGSRFSDYLKGKGLHSPDSMIRFVLTTFHRHLNEMPLSEDLLLEALISEEEAEREERMKKAEVISSEKRVRDQDK